MAANVRAGGGGFHPRSVKALWVAVLLLGVAASATAQRGAYSRITEYPLPGDATLSSNITTGPHGALWFIDSHSGLFNLARITTTGVVTEYPLPTVTGPGFLITAGPDGALWFTEYDGNKIGRITTAGVVTEYPVPTSGSGPGALTTGPDGALWFTESSGNKIGRITTAGVITEYPLPTPDSDPFQVTAGPDGALWFSELAAGKIGRITTDGVITAEYPVGSGPRGITAGPDGALWFTMEDFSRIGRITTTGVIKEYRASCCNNLLDQITAGPDGALWFTELLGENGIGRITTAGVITEYPLPTHNSSPEAITPGPDGALWFLENGSNKIGRAPACGLGFSASFANSTLTMNFTLGTDTPATFDIVLRNSNGPSEPFSKAIPAVVPPRAFTMSWGPFPSLGYVDVFTQLRTAPAQPLCAEWVTVDTSQ